MQAFHWQDFQIQQITTTMMYGQILHHQGREEDLINLNVGGIQHKVERCVLLRFPNTRVGQLIQCCSDAAILELCDDYSPAEQDQEIEYWGICELDLEACCLDWFLERKQNACGRSGGASSEDISVVSSDLWRFEGTWCSETRKLMWQTLEDPSHSKCSKGVAVVSVLVILTSIVAMCIHSMPKFRHATDREHSVLDSLEVICILFFSVEFVLRVVAAPRPWSFLGSPLNMIDIASILPFYVTLAFESLDEDDGEENQSLVNMGKMVQVLRLMRAFRVLKLARHSEGMRAFGETLKNCHSEVGLLILFINIGVSFFSTFIYYTEKEEALSKLSSIPVCWWWAIVSMTTVGYGDVYPQTVAGRIVATLCILCGLLVTSLPITVIMNTFSKYFERNALRRCLSEAKP
ncbi:potassium voltage-gated channel subfamily S member 3b isoform X2 [Pimephales promelas]|uniref:potassium voltage-gated channel subfamily S member 3b isoform X2 n=1 Tax=Pimephales promelas TaxID=90988 RepID=UPI0019557CF4|nr:potassium voltage-gated channel subfamily S member 3b isoform X2 [Pimephales promelas]